MPAPSPDRNWLGQNWDMFATGVQYLNPASPERIRDDYARENQKEGYENYISMPWESPFWVYPGNMTPGERADMYDRMIGSPDADAAGSFGRMLNGLDNVQDVVVSVGLLGHLALWAAAGLLGPIAPIIGGLLFLADLLAALTTLGQLLSLLYAFLCNGIGAGLAAAVPAALFARDAKGKFGKLLWNNPHSRQAWFRQPPNSILRPTGLTLLSQQEAWRRALPRFGWGGAWGLAIQLPQATATAFGYGVALGGIVGSITQGAAGAEKLLAGQPVHHAYDGDAHKRWAGINRRLRDDNPAELWLLHRSAAVMATAPTLLRYPDLIPAGYYFATLTALSVATEVVYHRLHGYPWQQWLDETMDSPLEHVSNVPQRLTAAHAALGIKDGDSLPWDYPGNPISVRPTAYVNHVAPAIAAGVDRFLSRNRMMPFAAPCGEMVNRLTELSWQQLTDEQAPIRWELTADAAILEVHALLSRVPAQVGDLQRIWSYWQELRAEHPRRPTAKWTGEYLDAVAERHGVKLIRFLPPDAPWPPEWVAWLNAGRHTPPA